MLSYIWCLADNRIFVQCYPCDALGIPAEETSHSSRWWRETTFGKCLAQIDCLEWNCNFCSLTVSTVFLCTVNTSDNKTLPEGGLHGENWPNSPSTIWIYYKINWIYLLLLYIWQINTIHCFLFLFPRSLSLRLFVCVIVCFQQREPFKKRWFTLCSINRKLLYFKTPLVINRLWHSVYRVCERFQLLTKCRY